MKDRDIEKMEKRAILGLHAMQKLHNKILLADSKDRPGGLVEKGMEESTKHSSSARPKTLRPTAISKKKAKK